MTHFKIVINCGACEDYIDQCLASVQKQTYTNFEAFVTVDPCGDRTFERAVKAADDDARIQVLQNKTRRYSLENLVRAIGRSSAGPEDVIVNLDGDDWFADRDALKIIADTYERFDCWVTYGSWVSNTLSLAGKRNGMWPAYPEGTKDFRNHRFLATAVRTWKKWIWDRIADEDLRGASGAYVRASEDQMIMIPLLEMCGTERAKHIAAPIMVYNKLLNHPQEKGIEVERTSNGLLIERRRPYRRLKRKTYSSTARRSEPEVSTMA
jgi:glycosyltransferase involved in cell wall biosynthesis